MKIPKNYKRYITLMMLQVLAIISIEISSIILSVYMYNFIPFCIGLVVCISLAIFLAEYYYTGSFFKCTECERSFKAKRKEFMTSIHIKKGRVFTCPDCAKKVRCKEGFLYGTTFR